MLACCYEEALIPAALGSDLCECEAETGRWVSPRRLISIVDTLPVFREWQEPWSAHRWQYGLFSLGVISSSLLPLSMLRFEIDFHCR